MTVEYDLPVVLDGTVASIEAKLPELSDAQLAVLAELEQGGKTRVTLLTAIKAEQDGRVQAAAIAAGAPLTEQPETAPDSESEQASAALPSEAGDETPPVEPGPDADDSQDGTFADAPHPDPAVNDAEAIQLGHYRAKQLELIDALEQAGYKVTLGDDLISLAVTAIREMNVLPVETSASGEIVPPEGALALLELSAEADGATALIVMFEGVSGRPIPALGKLTFSPSDFMQDAGGKSRTLARAIVFPSDVPATEVSGVWLLDEDGEPWSRCALIVPLPVGGGRSASIPASYLRFDAPAQVRPIQAAA